MASRRARKPRSSWWCRGRSRWDAGRLWDRRYRATSRSEGACPRALQLVERGARLLFQPPQVTQLTQQREHSLDGDGILGEGVGHVLGRLIGAAHGLLRDALDTSAIAGAARDRQR